MGLLPELQKLFMTHCPALASLKLWNEWKFSHFQSWRKKTYNVCWDLQVPAYNPLVRHSNLKDKNSFNLCCLYHPNWHPIQTPFKNTSEYQITSQSFCTFFVHLGPLWNIQHWVVVKISLTTGIWHLELCSKGEGGDFFFTARLLPSPRLLLPLIRSSLINILKFIISNYQWTHQSPNIRNALFIITRIYGWRDSLFSTNSQTLKN